MRPWFDELRLFLRTWPRTPAFAGTAVAVLALGIGAVAIAFTFLDAILLHRSPIRDLDRLVSIWTRDLGREAPLTESSYPAYLDWRDQGRGAFEAVTAMASINVAYRLRDENGRGEPVRIDGRVVSDTFFTTLGARPLLGRVLAAEDNAPGARDVLVMSWGLWQRQFGGRASIVGETMRLNDALFTVVGVMPRDFQFPAGADVWIPIVPHHARLATDRRVGWLETIARLRPGTAVERARREATAIAVRTLAPAQTGDGHTSARAAAENESGGRAPIEAVFVPLGEEIFGSSRPALVAIALAAALVLLIACANIGHLLLVRAAVRARETAVRQALGASRWHVARQRMVEALALSLTGGALGLLIASWATGALLPFVPVDLPGLDRVGVNGRTALATLLVSIAAGLLIALVSTLFASTRDVAEALKASAAGAGASGGDRRGRRVRRALMASQIALAVMVLIAMGLLVRSFAAIARLDLGFDPAGVLKLDVGLDDAGYDDVLARVRALPEVRAAGAVYLAPLEHGPIGMDAPFLVDGQPIAPSSYAANPPLNWEAATPGAFEAMGLPLLRGRLFDARDTATSPPVVIVGERLARYLASTDGGRGRVLGRRLITLDGPRDEAGQPAWQTVIGVVKDARDRELTRTRFDVYLPHTQTASPLRSLIVRARAGGDPLALIAPIRELVRARDPAASVDGIVLLDRVVRRARASWTFNALVFAAFGGLALALVAIGLFGLLAYAVATRTREIGIRLALGAQRRRIAGALLRECAAVTIAGLAAGVTAAWTSVQTLDALLFGVTPRDAPTFLLAPALVLLVAAAASWLPARAAMRVTPTVALRRD